MTSPTQRARRRQRREESRGQILAAADQFLRQRPFRELTVDELMAATGFSRTVFYRHFADLPDLVAALVRDVGAELLDTAERMASEDASPERLREGLAEVVDFFSRHGPLVRAVAEAASYDDEIEALYEVFLARFVDVTADALAQLVATGQVAPLDPRETARALTALNERYLLRSLGRGRGDDADRVLDTIWTIWSRTLANGPTADGAAADGA